MVTGKQTVVMQLLNIAKTNNPPTFFWHLYFLLSVTLCELSLFFTEIIQVWVLIAVKVYKENKSFVDRFQNLHPWYLEYLTKWIQAVFCNYNTTYINIKITTMIWYNVQYQLLFFFTSLNVKCFYNHTFWDSKQHKTTTFKYSKIHHRS